MPPQSDKHALSFRKMSRHPSASPGGAAFLRLIIVEYSLPACGAERQDFHQRAGPSGSFVAACHAPDEYEFPRGATALDRDQTGRTGCAFTLSLLRPCSREARA